MEKFSSESDPTTGFQDEVDATTTPTKIPLDPMLPPLSVEDKTQDLGKMTVEVETKVS